MADKKTEDLSLFGNPKTGKIVNLLITEYNFCLKVKTVVPGSRILPEYKKADTAAYFLKISRTPPDNALRPHQ